MPRKKISGGNPHGFTPQHDVTPKEEFSELGQKGPPIMDEVQALLRHIDEGMDRLPVDRIPPALRALPGALKGSPGPIVNPLLPASEGKILSPPAPIVQEPVPMMKISEILQKAKDMKEARKKEVLTVSDPAKIRVTLMKDHTLEYPDLYLDIFVVGPQWEEQAFAAMFSRARCKKAKSLLEADLVIFTGGIDVDPALYGEEKHESTSFSKQRDDNDMEIYLKCLENGIPMLGICRGAQFLHVMNGGKLYQDIDNHQGEHDMWDVQKRVRLNKVSSCHHQAVIPNSDGFQLIATSSLSNNRWLNPEVCNKGHGIDVEAFVYRDTCCIGIQGHPEYAGYNFFTKWSLDLVNELVIINPDIEWRKADGAVSSSRRLKAEFVEERNARMKKRHGALC